MDNRKIRTRRAKDHWVFLNIPYDTRFNNLFLAYIAGLVQLGLTPKTTLGIPGGVTRVDRILDLIASCRYSIHDLSRVEIGRAPPATPRFNMPFELGLTLGWIKASHAHHIWFIYETQERRGHKSLSDLSGSDFNIHQGTVEGLMRELCNSFVRRHQPGVPQMAASYHQLRRLVPGLAKHNGSKSLYEARMFDSLIASSIKIRASTELHG